MFWRKSGQAAQTASSPTRLVVVCPKLKDSGMRGLVERAKEGIIAGGELGRKSGTKAVPVAVLFSEDALKYRFDIEAQKVEAKIKPLQKHLQTLNMEVVVVFSVQQRRPDELDLQIGDWMLKDCPKRPANEQSLTLHAHNQIYLLSAKGTKSQAKRSMAGGDIDRIAKYWKEERESKYQMAVWEARGEHLEGNRIAFPHHTLDNGITLEARACSDAQAGPVFFQEDMVSLIPGNNLDLKFVKLLAKRRVAVVLHDNKAAAITTARRPNNIWTPDRNEDGAEKMGKIGIRVEMI